MIGLYILISLIAALLLIGQLGFLSGAQPKNIGVKEGKLKPPSKTPNSVSSQADLYPDHVQFNYANIEPLPYIDNSTKVSIQKLSSILHGMVSITIIDEQPDYIYAQAKTPALKFVDDVEFWVNPAKNVIDIRSASRVGRKDFGVNRKRLEEIRAMYLAK